MKLEDLGYSPDLEKHWESKGQSPLNVGRVVAEHKERYIVKTAEKEFHAEIIGNLRYSANQRSDFPAVGDWVTITEYDDDKALIHSVLPRKSIIERQAVGKHAEKQIIATNIDCAFIVQAVDRDFNINRIERYLTICNSSNVNPVILLNKIDLVNEPELTELLSQIKDRIKEVPIVAVSNETKKGIGDLKELIAKGKTYCLLGSSGVGKSTLLNNLAGRELMKTGSISESADRGRHITSHRELIVLSDGGIIIDNPGMREVGIADTSGGLGITFEAIVELSKDCKFKDCTHTNEIDCAVLAAIEKGDLDEGSYENYMKMKREKERFELTIAEKRKKDKDFGKLIKHSKKIKKSTKYMSDD